MLIMIDGRRANIVYSGKQRTIEYAVMENGKMPAKEFFHSLSDNDQRRLYALFQLFGDTGRIRNREHFKKIEGAEFFEFKRFSLRMVCFMESKGRLVLTHGFIKKKDKIPPEEIVKARRIKAEYQSLKGSKP